MRSEHIVFGRNVVNIGFPVLKWTYGLIGTSKLKWERRKYGNIYHGSIETLCGASHHQAINIKC